jgi:hypothetical protein
MKYQFFLIVLAVLFLASEQRSSADIIDFIVTGTAGEGLLEGNIAPPTGQPGTGGIGSSGINYDTESELLHIDVQWGSANGYVDLTADVILLHLHGPTPSSGTDAFGEVAPVLITLSNDSSFNGSSSAGGVNGNFAVGGTDAQALIDGRMYINVHLTN